MSKSGATARGRANAILLGVLLSGALSWYLLSDYQIIKKSPRPVEYDAKGNPITPKLKVKWREMEPLKLKPEALEERKERYKNLMLEKERAERAGSKRDHDS